MLVLYIFALTNHRYVRLHMLHTESLNMHTPRIKSLKLETSSRIVSNLCVSCESAYASLSGVVVMGLSGVSISPSAGDGQHLYLHTVNARCLVKVNNTYSSASTVTLCLCVYTGVWWDGVCSWGDQGSNCGNGATHYDWGNMKPLSLGHPWNEDTPLS